MAFSLELMVLALAGYALGLGLGALAHTVWTLRGPANRVNAGARKR